MGMYGSNMYSNYRNARNENKANKKQQEMLAAALAQFQAGSKDAYGNKLSADNGGVWSYKLTKPSQQAVNNANNAMMLANTTANKTSSEIMRDNLLGKSLANTLTARANQQAAMRSGARTNSNLGKISSAYGREGSQRLRDTYQEGIKAGKNSTMYNAQLRDALNRNISTAQAPVSNIQSNLQGMVQGLNGAVMGQMNNIASNIKPKKDRLAETLRGADQDFNEIVDQVSKLLDLYKKGQGISA